MKAEKDRTELARRLGMLILSEYEGKPFEYTTLQAKLEEVLRTDFDRGFFGFPPLAADDPRRPKPRGRKAKGNV